MGPHSAGLQQNTAGTQIGTVPLSSSPWDTLASSLYPFTAIMTSEETQTLGQEKKKIWKQRLSSQGKEIHCQLRSVIALLQESNYLQPCILQLAQYKGSSSI